MPRTSTPGGRLLLGIIDDLLDLSRLEHGKLEIRAEIGRGRGDRRGLHTPWSTARHVRRGLRVVTALPAIPVRLEADALRLKQVLINLLTNALKYTPEGGRVTIGVSEQQNGEVLFDVADTGNRHDAA